MGREQKFISLRGEIYNRPIPVSLPWILWTDMPCGTLNYMRDSRVHLRPASLSSFTAAFLDCGYPESRNAGPQQRCTPLPARRYKSFLHRVEANRTLRKMLRCEESCRASGTDAEKVRGHSRMKLFISKRPAVIRFRHGSARIGLAKKALCLHENMNGSMELFSLECALDGTPSFDKRFSIKANYCLKINIINILESPSIRN